MPKHALLIGINAYPRLGDLRYAARDAEAVGEVLTQHYGFAPSNVTLMTCKTSGIFQPTQNNIEEQLARLRKIDDLELLVVGFWGHGIGVVSGGAECRRYLCAVDTSDERLERTGISLVALREFVEQAGAVNTCLILDCCQNQAVGRSVAQLSLSEEDRDFMSSGARDIVAAKPAEGAKLIARKAAILNSCSFGERAFEWQEREHGIFTAHLLDAMRQSDSVADWFEYIKPRVHETARRSMGQSQNPFASFDGGVIRFAVVESAKPEPVVDTESLLTEVRKKAEEEAAQIIAEAKRQAEIEASQIVEKAKKQIPASAVTHAILASAVSLKPTSSEVLTNTMPKVVTTVRIALDECTGCGECVSSCPLDSIVTQNGKAVIDDSCAECGACLDACPKNAIHFGLVDSEYRTQLEKHNTKTRVGYGRTTMVNLDKCTGCGECVSSCPLDSIVTQNGKAVIDDSCAECGACLDACPNKAIVL